MAKNKIFAIKDVKSGYLLPLIEHKSEKTILRDFEFAVNSGRGKIGQFPFDHEVYLIGEFDDDTAEFKSEVKYIASGRDFYKEKENGEKKILYTSGNENSTNVPKEN